jgi:hypothetical protein
LQRIAAKPEYFELANAHYYLLDTPLPSAESRRINEAMIKLSFQLLEKMSSHFTVLNVAEKHDSNSSQISALNQLSSQLSTQSPKKKRLRRPRKTYFGADSIYESYIPCKVVKEKQINIHDNNQLQAGPLFPAGIIPPPAQDLEYSDSIPEMTHHDRGSLQWEDPNIDKLQPHWAAISNFDLNLRGKYGIRTFKKIFQYGSQLGPIYDKITHQILINLPVNNPSYYCEQRLHLYFKLWILFPALFLRLDSSIKVIKHRITRFRASDWQTLISELIKDLVDPEIVRDRVKKKYAGKIPIQNSKLEVRYNKALHHIHDDGNLSKAFKAITSPSTITTPTVESLATLEALHPKRLPENSIDPGDTNFGKSETALNVCTGS